MIHFSFFDYAIIVLYFAIVLYIGFRTKAADSTKLDYLVAGRKLTLPIFVATIVSTFYGGILGIGEFTYNYGISSWFLYAFPYYVFIAIFAFLLAKRVRKSEFFTVPDKLDSVYGKSVSVASAVLLFLLATPAPYIFMLGVLAQVIFGFSLNVSMLLTLLLSIIYLFKGGLVADVRVNVFEFILMFLGFAIILPFCFLKLGNFHYLTTHLPAMHLSWTGGNSLSYILVWFFIGSWALVDPSFHQRCYAAESESVAKKGVLISLIFWFIFDCMTTVAGLYARAHLQNLDHPSMSYPLLADQILPSAAKGFFFVGMIATIMSTLHSYLFISATTIGRDIVMKIKPSITDPKNRLTKLGIIITSVISLGLAILIPSVVQIWYTIGSLVIPALLIGIISSYFQSLVINKHIMLCAMVGSFAICLISLIYGHYHLVDGYPSYLMHTEPMYPGLIVGLLVYGVGFFVKRFIRTSAIKI